MLGHKMHTLDIFKGNKIYPDICLFLDMPKKNIAKYVSKKTKTILIIREPQNILPENYNEKRWIEFDKILTWKRNLINAQNIHYIPSTRVFFEKKLEKLENNNRKLCCLINSNLSSNAIGELYSERKKVVKWFEKNNSENFDLYGHGWDEARLYIKERMVFSSKILAEKIKTYKGTAKNKIETLSQYKFSICFENTKNQEDYISEKIFDSFLSQTIPIYFGAPNIKKIIPKECFIDYLEFKDFETLYKTIKEMPDKTYNEYILAINNFMNSKSANNFSIEKWVDSILSVIKILVREKNENLAEENN